MEASHSDYWLLALCHPGLLVHNLVADSSFLSEKTLFHYGLILIGQSGIVCSIVSHFVVWFLH